jgi:hypothetical protein
MGELVTFDLSLASAEAAGTRRRVRLAMMVIVVLFSLLALWFVFIALTPGDFRDAAQKLVVGTVTTASSLLAANCAFVAWKNLPGATRLSINQMGVRLTWKTDRVEFVSWKEVIDRFVLLDYSANSFLATHLRFLWEIRRWNRPPTTLTREAFEALIAAARQQGLVVHSKMVGWSLVGYSNCQEYRLAPAATP